MANSTGNTTALSAWTIGAILSVAVIGGGIYVWRSGLLSQTANEPTLATDEHPADGIAELQISNAGDASPVTPITERSDQTFVLSAPELDLVRVDPEGSTLIAGRGLAGAEVAVLLDGAEIARQQISDTGEFVVFVTLEILNTPRVVSLISYLDGQTVTSDANFILAPIAAPPRAVVSIDPALSTDEAAVAPEVATETRIEPADQPRVAVSKLQAPLTPEIAEAVPPVEEGTELKDLATQLSEQVETELATQVDNTIDDTLGIADDITDDVAKALTSSAIENSEREILIAEGVSTDVASSPAVVSDTRSINSPQSTQAPDGVETHTNQNNVGTDAPSPYLATAEEVAVPSETETAPKPKMYEVVVADAVTEGAAPTAPVTLETGKALVSSLENTQTQTALQQDNQESAPKIETDPAPNPARNIAVLRADDSGVSLLQAATPSAPEFVGKVSLETISYIPNGHILLSGRAAPASLVRVYLDNAVVADIKVAQDGKWAGSLTSVVPGLYTLRVDEIDAAEGKVLSRIETPFKREILGVLAPVRSIDSGVSAPKVHAVTVQQGDTLWAISNARYGSGFLFVRVVEANQDAIKNPDLIYPGQVFNLPE